MNRAQNILTNKAAQNLAFGWQQSHCKVDVVEYVDLDHYKFSEIPSVVQNVVDVTWVSNEIITLKESHKDILTGGSG